MKFTKYYLGILFISSFFIGCLKDLPTRPGNDIEALYKCKAGVDTQSCEKEIPWWLFALNQQQAESSAGGNNNGGTPDVDGADTNTETVATPTFKPSPGSYTKPENIEILTTTEVATIYYTTDGTDPTTSSIQYSTALENTWIFAGKIIKAFAVKSGFKDSSITSAVFSYPPLKTGQTTKYSDRDDGEFQKGVNRSYTDNSNGTITDNATGLIWQKCNKGQNETDCSGTADNMLWADAEAYCNGLNLNNKKWRLPNRHELATLLDFSKIEPVIDTNYL